jgi:hypothetical protein
MARPALEVAEIFRDHGAAWREANRGHVSLGQLKVMSAIESCRTAALGGHVARCENGACGHTVIAYNSCRNRHCVKCQGAAARDWLTEREADLLPVPYFHVVFSLPAEIADIAYQNKAVVYDLLFRISAETMRMLEALCLAHKAGKLVFFNNLAHLADAATFADFLEPLKEKKWHVYAKRPFAGPKAVLAYLARYTHRVAISNRRLISADANGVTFKYKDYRIDGPSRYTRMTVHPHEFIRRFLIHVLPKGLHRIRHYGLLANGQREESLAKSRALLGVKPIDPADDTSSGDPADAQPVLHSPCPCCGARMLIIETFEGVCRPRPTPSGPRADTS